METNFATCVLCLQQLLYTISQRNWALPKFYVSQVQKLQELWILSVFFISACLEERRGLGLWSLHIAKPNISCQLKFRERKERHSEQRNCLHSGADLLQVEIRVAHYFENLQNGGVERLIACIPSLCYVRQTYLVWFLCEEDFKDTEVEIHMVKVFCERSCLWFISCVLE